jgi:hypothetical protein
MKIEETLTIVGFAWIDQDDKSVNWAMKEDMEDIPPAQRPPGCTPVIIEISPTEEWLTRKQKDHEFLGDLASQINQFSAELTQLQKSIKSQR